jgi:hypothetical protein
MTLTDLTDKFARFCEKGIIGPNDSCVVAIAASQFAPEADADRGGKSVGPGRPPFPGSNPGTPATQRGLCRAISPCVRTHAISEG